MKPLVNVAFFIEALFVGLLTVKAAKLGIFSYFYLFGSGILDVRLAIARFFMARSSLILLD